jgi:hypothetical protein
LPPQFIWGRGATRRAGERTHRFAAGSKSAYRIAAHRFERQTDRCGNQTPDRIDSNEYAADGAANRPKAPGEKQSALLPEPKINPRARKSNRYAGENRTFCRSRSASPSWTVETLAGMPRIGDSLESEKLAVGETWKPTPNSRARVQVADIGDVEVAPNSRVKLVNTKSTEHRLALEKGTLKATNLRAAAAFHRRYAVGGRGRSRLRIHARSRSRKAIRACT